LPDSEEGDHSGTWHGRMDTTEQLCVEIVEAQMELSRALSEEGVEYLRQYPLHFAHLYIQTSTFVRHDLSSLHITPHDFTVQDDTS